MFEQWLFATKNPQNDKNLESESDSPRAEDTRELVDVMQYFAEGKVANPDPSQVR